MKINYKNTKKYKMHCGREKYQYFDFRELMVGEN